jgi:hypothetical protein
MDEEVDSAGRKIALVTGAKKGIRFEVRGVGAGWPD